MGLQGNLGTRSPGPLATRGADRAHTRGARVWLCRPIPLRSAVLVFSTYIFDKWLYFYILIGNRNNTSDAQKSQVPAQAGDERVSNERQRLLQGKKMQDGGGRSQTRGNLVVEGEGVGFPGPGSSKISGVCGSQVMGRGSREWEAGAILKRGS